VSTERQKQQITLSEEIQDLLLKNFKELLISGEASATDRATITRFLMGNGWSVDPSVLPQALLDKLQTSITADDLDEDDIIDIRRSMGAS
jgi:hypothetical protein